MIAALKQHVENVLAEVFFEWVGTYLPDESF